MEQIVLFCNKTIEETAIKIDNTEPILKQKLEKKEYEEIKKTITSNEVATKSILRILRKFKKYRNVKYKLTRTVKVKKIVEEIGNAENRT